MKKESKKLENIISDLEKKGEWRPLILLWISTGCMFLEILDSVIKLLARTESQNLNKVFHDFVSSYRNRDQDNSYIDLPDFDTELLDEQDKIYICLFYYSQFSIFVVGLAFKKIPESGLDRVKHLFKFNNIFVDLAVKSKDELVILYAFTVNSIVLYHEGEIEQAILDLNEISKAYDNEKLVNKEVYLHLHAECELKLARLHKRINHNNHEITHLKKAILLLESLDNEATNSDFVLAHTFIHFSNVTALVDTNSALDYAKKAVWISQSLFKDDPNQQNCNLYADSFMTWSNRLKELGLLLDSLKVIGNARKLYLNSNNQEGFSNYVHNVTWLYSTLGLKDEALHNASSQYGYHNYRAAVENSDNRESRAESCLLYANCLSESGVEKNSYEGTFELDRAYDIAKQACEIYEDLVSECPKKYKNKLAESLLLTAKIYEKNGWVDPPIELLKKSTKIWISSIGDDTCIPYTAQIADTFMWYAKCLYDKRKLRDAVYFSRLAIHFSYGKKSHYSSSNYRMLGHKGLDESIDVLFNAYLKLHASKKKTFFLRKAIDCADFGRATTLVDIFSAEGSINDIQVSKTGINLCKTIYGESEHRSAKKIRLGSPKKEEIKDVDVFAPVEKGEITAEDLNFVKFTQKDNSQLEMQEFDFEDELQKVELSKISRDIVRGDIAVRRSWDHRKPNIPKSFRSLSFGFSNSLDQYYLYTYSKIDQLVFILFGPNQEFFVYNYPKEEFEKVVSISWMMSFFYIHSEELLPFGDKSFDCLAKQIQAANEDHDTYSPALISSIHENFAQGFERILSYFEEEIFSSLWCQLFSKIYENTSKRKLVIFQSGIFNIIPLHSVRIPTRECLEDCFEITNSQSISTFNIIRKRSKNERQDNLIISNPNVDLKFSSMEPDFLKSSDEDTVLSGPQCKLDKVMECLPEAVNFIFSGHGAFFGSDQLQSGLILNDSILTSEMLIKKKLLRNCNFVFVNSCYGGIMATGNSDDYINLSAALLNSGANCVLSNLWLLNDFSAFLFSFKFHSLWRYGKGLSLPVSLSETKKWIRGDGSGSLSKGELLVEKFYPELRKCIRTKKQQDDLLEKCKKLAQQYPDTAPFADPVYWSGYTLYGNPW